MFFGGFPGGGSGFPFDMGGHDHSGPVDNEGLYNDLGLKKDCSAADVKKAFRKLAMKAHPDKGGDPEEFKKICKAYEILSDEQKRSTYDKYGLEAVEGNGGPSSGGDASDIFSMFFGGGGQGASRPRGPRKGEPSSQNASVTLKQIFEGCTKKYNIRRSVVCAPCSGVGGSEKTTCTACGGRGQRVQIIRSGNMIQQISGACDNCQGAGKYIEPSKICRSCNGRCTVPKTETVEVRIPAGALDGQKIVVESMGDEGPNIIAGDLIFIVRVTNDGHPHFTRKGEHLIMEKSITMAEALNGHRFKFQHLDDEEHTVRFDNVIMHGDILQVPGQGLPINSILNRGNLYVKYTVIRPTRNQLAGLKINFTDAELPPASNFECVGRIVTKIPEPVERRQEAYHGDDSDDHEGGGVQCRQA